MNKSQKATCVGLTAPIFWGTCVGLIRIITEEFSLSAGLTILYGTTVAYLLCVLGFPKIKKMSLKYLFFGIPLANLCALLFCVSMFLCQNERQTVEVGMVNYMWPCLVVFLSIFVNKEKMRWWIYPAMAISFIGIAIVLGGEKGLDAESIVQNVSSNPAPYVLAFFGALSWGMFSNLTKRWHETENPTVLIFAIDFVIFGTLWACGYGSISHVSTAGWISVFLGAITIGSGYAAWNYGVEYGNMNVLAIASYFTPVLSCIFASLWIGAPLGANLLIGVSILILGSILSNSARRSRLQPARRRSFAPFGDNSARL